MNYLTKQIFYIPLVILVGIGMMGCKNADKPLDYDSGPEIANEVTALKELAGESQEKADASQQAMDAAAELVAQLGMNNKCLQDQVRHKQDALAKALQDMYDESRGTGTFEVDCQTCHRKVTTSQNQFEQKYNEFNTGAFRTYSSSSITKQFSLKSVIGSLFGSVTWRLSGYRYHPSKLEALAFSKCPQCTTDEDIAALWSTLAANKDKIAQAEKEALDATKDLEREKN